MCIRDSCYTIRNTTDNVKTEYLYQFLKSKESEIMKLRIGSGLPVSYTHLVDPAPSPKPDDDTDVPDDGDLGDVDFCLELLHSDIINVAYILSLIHILQ